MSLGFRVVRQKKEASENGSIERGGSGVFNSDSIASKLDHQVGDKINEKGQSKSIQNPSEIDPKMFQNRSPEGLWSASGGSLAPKVVLECLRAVFLLDLKRSWASSETQEGVKLDYKNIYKKACRKKRN